MLKLITTATFGLAMLLASANDGCDSQPMSASGVSKATTTVQTGSDGLTVEQRNVKDRLAMDNKPGSIKHLYVISPISGQCILYSTVRGKVTSSGKRLTPTSTSSGYGFRVDLNNGGMATKDGDTNNWFYTSEVLQDDGTYGASSEYLYWFDSRGIYHQIYPGSVFIELSDQPLPIKSITINLEAQPN